ncbi:hypothetical protein PVAP13_4NG164244 [Panicum virgatum]|uniref:Uncharacterized protein n=1 Tax=Panicum virgatum TaxID=38727 RepID=A0A8T0TFP9_PANVG|nr:hypothetical protein PVAP13_4NG164244 [Panicum virgatum]
MVAELRRIKSELRKIPEMNTNLTSEIDSYTNNEDPRQITDRHTSTSLICNGTRSTADYEVPTLIVQQKDFPDSGKDTDLFKNPDVVPRKGRPKTMQKSRRLVPYGEIVRTKKQITCSTCGSHEHNRATCTKVPGEGGAVKKKASTTKKNSQSNTNYKQHR